MSSGGLTMPCPVGGVAMTAAIRDERRSLPMSCDPEAQRGAYQPLGVEAIAPMTSVRVYLWIYCRRDGPFARERGRAVEARGAGTVGPTATGSDGGC